MKGSITIGLLLCLQTAIAQQTPLSQQIATNVMNNWKDSFALDGKPAKWTYDMGVILKGFEGVWQSTGDPKYYN